MNLIIPDIRFYLSYEIKITERSSFWCDNVRRLYFLLNLLWTSFYDATKICKMIVCFILAHCVLPLLHKYFDLKLIIK